jgi:hypothetical protein
LPALRYYHTLNATVIVHDLKQLPVRRLPQHARHIAGLAMPHLDNGDTVIGQILRSFGNQVAIKQQAIVPAIKGFRRLIASDCGRQRGQLFGSDVRRVGE